MGEICNPCAVQVSSKLTFVYLETGHLAIHQCNGFLLFFVSPAYLIT